MGFLMKILVLGDKGVGIDTIKEKFLGRGFTTDTSKTGIRPTLLEYTIDKTFVRFQIHVLDSSKKFEPVRIAWSKGAHGAILVFDVSSKKSFEKLAYFSHEIFDNIGFDRPMVILGNKIDLLESKKKKNLEFTPEETVLEYCRYLSKETIKNKGYEVKYFPISALNDENINDVFDYLGKSYFNFLEKRKKS